MVLWENPLKMWKMRSLVNSSFSLYVPVSTTTRKFLPCPYQWRRFLLGTTYADINCSHWLNGANVIIILLRQRRAWSAAHHPYIKGEERLVTVSHCFPTPKGDLLLDAGSPACSAGSLDFGFFLQVLSFKRRSASWPKSNIIRV